MRTSVRIALATAIAIVTLGAATSVALSASTLSFSTASTTETISNLTIRDNVLGNIIANLFLFKTLPVNVICPPTGTSLGAIGALTSARMTIISPAGMTGVVVPTTAWVRCVNGRINLNILGNPKLYKLRFSFTLNGPLGAITYTGDVESDFGASPSATLTGVSSSFTSSIGSTATFALPWTVGDSPAIVWTAI